MKPVWEKLFFGMDENRMKKENFATYAGIIIRDDLRKIEDAIKSYDLIKALAIIDELKNDY